MTFGRKPGVQPIVHRLGPLLMSRIYPCNGSWSRGRSQPDRKKAKNKASVQKQHAALSLRYHPDAGRRGDQSICCFCTLFCLWVLGLVHGSWDNPEPGILTYGSDFARTGRCDGGGHDCSTHSKTNPRCTPLTLHLPDNLRS